MKLKFCPFGAFVGFLLALIFIALTGCSSGSGPETQSTKADGEPSAIIPVDGMFQPFEPAEKVDALAFGMAPAIDNTAALQAALGAGNRHVVIPAGEYPVSQPVFVRKNTVLELRPGAILRDMGQLRDGQRLLNVVRAENVRIIGHGAAVLADRSSYTSGEQRHGVIIQASTNVLIEGLESSGHGGDGFYVGTFSHNITLRGVLADNNRRQGLSITSVTDMYVFDSEFHRTRGTAPEYGIDIEPNNPKDPIANVNLIRVATRNNRGAGIGVLFDRYDQTAAAGSVLIVDHTGGKYVTRLTRPQDDIRYIQSR